MPASKRMSIISEWQNNPFTTRSKLLQLYKDCVDPNAKEKIAKLLLHTDPQIRAEYVKLTRLAKNGLKYRKKTLSNSHQRLYIYSKKLARKYTSSQEVVGRVIKGLAENNEIIILRDKFVDIDQYYSTSYQIADVAGFSQSGIVIDFSGDPPVEIINRDDVILLDIMRTPIFSSDDISCVYGGESTEFKACPGTVCISGVHPIIYPIDDRCGLLNRSNNSLLGSIPQDGKVNIAAFCRCHKLIPDTLNIWASVVKLVNARLIFAGLNMSKPLQASLYSYLTGLGLETDQFIILPNMDRATTMSILSHCTLSLGAVPEGGGMSLYESLYLGVPVVEASWLAINSIAQHISWRNKTGLFCTNNLSQFNAAVRDAIILSKSEECRRSITREFIAYNRQNEQRWIYAINRLLDIVRQNNMASTIISRGYCISV